MIRYTTIALAVLALAAGCGQGASTATHTATTGAETPSNLTSTVLLVPGMD